MHLAQEALLEFHKKMAQTIGDPRSPDIQQEKEFRLRLIREELKELEEALEASDTVEAADALADLCYVIIGSAVTWGIDLASVFDEVHRSNMTKKCENKREDGKVLKDKDFSPPDIQGVLDEVADNFDDGPDGWWETPTIKICNRCNRKVSKSAGCKDGSCNKGPVFDVPIPQHEPSKTVNDRIMLEAKTQARYLGAKQAMKEIQADFLPGVKSSGVTKDGAPYTVNEKAWKAYTELPAEMAPELHKSATVIEHSDGVPDKTLSGQMTSYGGAFVFDCFCGRTHAIQARLGSRGGLAHSGKCECMCGKAYVVEFTKDPPLIWETTIDELRKAHK